MRLSFLGTGSFGVPALHALLEAGHEVAAVFSQPDRPARRGLTVEATPICAAARAAGLRHIQTEDVNVGEHAAVLSGCDAAVVVAFGQKLGPELLSATRLGFINLHASLLPRHRGAAPYQWAILSGDAETGVTTFRINVRWDAGDILAQRATPIGELETADELHDRLARLGAPLVVETLRGLEDGSLRPWAQDASQATRAPKLSRADSVLDWSLPADRVVRRIHGLWSWPTATCVFVSRDGRRERVQLARARVADASAAPSASGPPGAFLADGSVQAGAGRVELLEVKPAGGKLMPFAAFAHGRHIAPPDRWAPIEAP